MLSSNRHDDQSTAKTPVRSSNADPTNGMWPQAFDRLLGDGACQKQCADAGLPIDLEWLNSTVTTNEVGGCSQPAASVRLRWGSA